MKILITSFILLIFSPVIIQIDYTRVELGTGFYFLGDSNGNDILYRPYYEDTTQTSTSEISRIVWPVITNVEYFGFNKKFILASSKNNYQVNYWIIDKTKVANEIFSKEEGDRIAFQFVKKIDSLKFFKIKISENIEVFSISYYQKLLKEK